MNLAIHKKLMLAMIQSTPDTSLLPREYQRVEYIEGTGTQIIDTGVQHTDYTSFTGSFKYTTNAVYTVLGVQDSSTNMRAVVSSSGSQWGTSTKPTGYYGPGYGGPHYVKMSDWHTFEFGYGYFNVDDEEKTFATLNFYPATLTIALFGCNNKGTLTPSPIAIGEIKIYTGQNEKTLVRDFVPCYRKSDGVVGMYDLCGSVCPLTGTPFYINANGSDNFIKGADVNDVL